VSYALANPHTCALICIDVQREFTLPGVPAHVPGTWERLPGMRGLAQAFRTAGRPIVHLVRLYLENGSNVDASGREAIEEGLQLVAPGMPGAGLMDDLQPRRQVKLDAERSCGGRPL